jgi:hypothetical protein
MSLDNSTPRKANENTSLGKVGSSWNESVLYVKGVCFYYNPFIHNEWVYMNAPSLGCVI